MTAAHDLATGPASSDNSLRSRATKVAKAVVGHNDNEALRSGVPIVSTGDWIREAFSSPRPRLSEYFPLINWLPSYNVQWGIGDLIAGITVALVLVPQSMSYAQLANLAPEFGLYSSFVGVMIYALFATSKDVTIGPVAVMSLQTGQAITKVLARHPGEWRPEQIASAIAFLCGAICFGIGLLRLGWITRYIPAPAVSGFMTGSAITIAAGQVPKLMGLTVTTNGVATYKVIINSLKALPQTNINAAFGLTALAFLYIVRGFCNYGARRWPRLSRTFFFISVLRNAFVIIVLTVASKLWLNKYNVGSKPKYPISILKDVPRGFQHMGQPDLNRNLLTAIAPELPVSVIVLLLEHIAIAQSFGRVNNYKINPNQELLAIGVTNLVGPSFGAYAATGSFSRTAIKAKSGVRTPIAGWITGIVVIIAIYALTGCFYWIPNAALSAVIIHAVGDLIASPKAAYQFWLVQPLEFFIFLAGVVVTIFASIDIGIYVTIASSLALLLVRVAHPRGRWLGVVRVSHEATQRESGENAPAEGSASRSITSTIYGGVREVFVPIQEKAGLHDPSIHVRPPPPGVLIYRLEDGLIYANASHIADVIVDKAKFETRPTGEIRYKSRGDRPWNDPGPPNPYLLKAFRAVTCASKRRGSVPGDDDGGLPTVSHEAFAGVAPWHGQPSVGGSSDTRPVLRAIIFDFSSVSNVDTTSIQTLVDVRRSVERYSGQLVEFHFASVLSPWIRRGLLAGGFGTGSADRTITEIAPVVPHHEYLTHEEVSRANEAADARRAEQQQSSTRRGVGFAAQDDIEKDGASSSEKDDGTPDVPALSKDGGLIQGDRLDDGVNVPVVWANELTPFFHLDLASALDAVTREQ